MPYIMYNPIGGSDFAIIGILARKIGFLPRFIPERCFDVLEANGTTFGVIHRVGG